MTTPLTVEEELKALCQVLGLQLKIGKGQYVGKAHTTEFAVSIWTGDDSLLDYHTSSYRSSQGGFRYFFTTVEQALKSVRKIWQ